jgi:hypothetical protein
MQLSMESQHDYQQTLMPVVEVKAFCLESEILSKIRSLPESEQAQLLALAAPKLKDEKLIEALNMVLSLKDGLLKGLALIDFLACLEKVDMIVGARAATEEIFNSIEAIVEKQHKISLTQSFIKQLNKLQLYRSKSSWFNYLIDVSQKLALFIKNNFGLQEQIVLEGQSFKLVYWHDLYKHYSLYPIEKKRLTQAVKSINNPVEKYLALLALLKEFPLAQEEISELTCLALEVLREVSSENSADSNDKSKIKLEEKIRLLAFLPKEYHKSFGKELYDELCKSPEPIVDDIINSSIFAKYYDCDTAEQNWEQFDYSSYAASNIDNALHYVCNFCEKSDEEYFELITLLTSDRWINVLGWSEVWTSDVLALTKRIKSPITQVDALLLVLEKITPGKLKREILEQTLNTIALIKDGIENITLTIKLLKYLNKSDRNKTVSKLMVELTFPWDEAAQAELLIDLIPYLTPKLRKQAFDIALSIGNYFDTIWACIAFAPYLTQEMRGRVIQDGFNVLNKPAYSITFNQKALMLKQLIHYGLGSANEG